MPEYPGAEEEIGRQSDNAFDVSPICYQILANLRFGIASEQNAVRKDAGSASRMFDRPHDMKQESVVAVFLRRDAYRRAPTMILVFFFRTFQPRFGRKRGIGHHEIERLEIT